MKHLPITRLHVKQVEREEKKRQLECLSKGVQKIEFSCLKCFDYSRRWWALAPISHYTVI